MMKRWTLLGASLAAVAMAAPGVAQAHDGPPVDVFTVTFKGTDVITFAGPCGGGPGTATLAFHDKFHVTAFEDGHAVFSAVQTGTFEFDPDDPAEPSSSGRYRNGSTDTFMQNAGSSTSIFTVVGRDDDGQQVRFQVRSHFTFANGEVRVDNMTVACP